MKISITGGAGFVGSNLAKFLISTKELSVDLKIIDDLSVGKLIFIDEMRESKNVSFHHLNCKDTSLLAKVFVDSDLVIHLAANSDIAKAATAPHIDFENGTFLTHSVLEACRISGVKKFIFSSGSGVYGDVDSSKISENHSPLIPISTYGASKLSSEALISAYSYLFGINAVAIRFANIIGPNSTHGVIHDLITKLLIDPKSLKIMGNGTQTKPYIHVSEVAKFIYFLIRKDLIRNFEVYNFSCEDEISVNSILEIILTQMALENVKVERGLDSRGWKADVPNYRLDNSKLKNLGFIVNLNSIESVTRAVAEIYAELQESVTNAK
jgi:UDP-glucose 4-epimerase